jgi:hypothetical protein
MAIQNKTRRAGGAAGLGIDCSLRGSENSPRFNTVRRFLQAPRFEQKFRRDVEAACRLGAPAIACLLEEIAAGRDLRKAVAEYASLDSGIVAAFGGERFPPSLRAIGGAP